MTQNAPPPLGWKISRIFIFLRLPLLLLNILVAELAPASTEITAVAEDIVNSDVTCTAEEKLELDVQKAALEELIVEAKDALAVILEHLAVLLPGTTLDIVTTPLPTLPTVITTTAGTRRRMRGFVNQFVI